MRKYLLIAVMALAVASFMIGCGSESLAPDDNPAAIAKGTVTYVPDAFAAALNASDESYVGTYGVYTPPNYDADRTEGYPVVYMLHGFGGNEFYFSSIFNASEVLDYLIAEGEVEPMILVYPSAKNALGGSFYTNSDHQAVNESETHILNIITAVDAAYNTIDDPSGRGISGASMGGFGAISIALNNSGKFGSISIHAGPLTFAGSPDIGYEGIKSLLPAALLETGYATVLEETNGAGDPAAYAALSPTAGTITAFMFAAAAAWSPSDSSYMPTHHPLGVNLPIGVDGQIDTTTYDRWMAFDPIARMMVTQSASIDPANDVALYLTAGEEDDLGFNYAHQFFAGVYQARYGVAPTTSEIYEAIPNNYGSDIKADHTTQTFKALFGMLRFHGEQF